MRYYFQILHAFVVLATLADASEPPMRAMWVYKTGEIMASAAEQGALFAFCAERQITDLFWQVHFDRSDAMKLKEQEPLRAFLKAAHGQRLRIHTLGGDPVHTLTRNHERVLAMADEVLAFNRGGEPLDGMHLDIEPHALPAWKDASVEDNCALLTQLVDLHTKMAARLHEADPRLQYGADIVFWLDKLKPDGTPAYPVTYNGVTQDAAKFILDVVDNVGIMSYRSSVDGKNGMLALVERTIAYADTARGRAFVGVNMASQSTPKESFFGSTESAMMSQLKKVDDAYRGHRGYAGLSFFQYEAFKVMPRE